MIRSKLASALLAVAFAGCGANFDHSDLKLRRLSQNEAEADFKEIVNKVRAVYGPLKFKEARFGYTLDELVTTAETEIAAADSDAEYFSAYQKFLASFEDGHVSIRFPENNDPVLQYQIPIFVTPIEGKAIVVFVGDEVQSLGIEVGDEILSVDGKTPSDVLAITDRYFGYGNAVTDEHSIYRLFYRPFYVTELIPAADAASITYLSSTDAAQHTVSAIWRTTLRHDSTFDFVTDGQDAVAHATMSNEFNEAAKGSWREFAAVDPFFVNATTKARFGLTRVHASDEMLRTYGVDPAKVPEIYSALYNYGGKTILLIRQAGYGPAEGFEVSDYIGTYRAILDQFDDFADGLVIEQTHNPGGYVSYVTDLFRLFITPEMGSGPNFVQAQRANRQWVSVYSGWAREIDSTLSSEDSLAVLAMSKVVEQAYDAGEFLSAPVPFDISYTLRPDDKYVWTKPVLVLTNELAGSGGDAFPMIMQRSGRAKIFGERTMGLGGSVEKAVTLSHSLAEVRLTMGLFTAYRQDGTYSEDQWIENNGVLPDVPHRLSVADFKADFVGYVDAFSAALLEQL